MHGMDEAYLFVLGARVVHRIDLNPRSTSLGSRDDNDVVLRAASVLPQHARFRFQEGNYVLEPLQNQETYRNGRLVWPRERLTDGDVVRFGRVELLFALHSLKTAKPMEIQVEREGEGIVFEIRTWLHEVVIGRARGDLLFDDRALSGEHMRIEHYGGRLFITDLNSTNRVAVRGDVIPQDARLELEPGADVQAGTLTFRFRPPPPG